MQSRYKLVNEDNSKLDKDQRKFCLSLQPRRMMYRTNLEYIYSVGYSQFKFQKQQQQQQQQQQQR